MQVSGHACQVVAPGGKATRNVLASDLSNNGRCDTSVAVTVESVTSTIVN